MDDSRATPDANQPWSDVELEHGQIVLVTDNPIARAIVEIAAVAGRRTTLLPDDSEVETPLDWLYANPLEPEDAFVMCDHDTPGASALLQAALEGESSYVAMMGSRRRAESVFADLDKSMSADTLARLRVPAGLNIGGKAPGEIALSVVAQIVASAYGRDGGPMKSRK